VGSGVRRSSVVGESAPRLGVLLLQLRGWIKLWAKSLVRTPMGAGRQRRVFGFILLLVSVIVEFQSRPTFEGWEFVAFGGCDCVDDKSPRMCGFSS
jgi:hypothetical protein